MSIYTDTEMTGLPPEQQAKRAIEHALCRIRDHSGIGWYMGIGSSAFALLTEAYASLTGLPVDEVRHRFKCRDPRNPAEQSEEA